MLPQGIFVIIVLISKRVIDIVAREKAWVSQSTRPAFLAWSSSRWVVVYIYSSRKFHQLAAGQLLLGTTGTVKVKGRRYGPSITYIFTPAGSLSFSQPGWPPCWTSLLCLRPHCVRLSAMYSPLPLQPAWAEITTCFPFLIFSVPLSFLCGEVLHSSYRGLILGRNWDKSLPPSLLFTVTSTSGFYSPLGLPPPLGLKLVCNVNIVYKNLKSENSRNYAQKPQRNCTFINTDSVQNMEHIIVEAGTLA